MTKTAAISGVSIRSPNIPKISFTRPQWLEYVFNSRRRTAGRPNNVQIVCVSSILSSPRESTISQRRVDTSQKRPDFGRFVDVGRAQCRQNAAKNSRQPNSGPRGEAGDGVGEKFGHFLEHVRVVVGAENGGNCVTKRGSEEFRGNRRI